MYEGNTKDIEKNPKFKFFPRSNKVTFEDKKETKNDDNQEKVRVTKKDLSKK